MGSIRKHLDTPSNQVGAYAEHRCHFFGGLVVFARQSERHCLQHAKPLALLISRCAGGLVATTSTLR